jgi:hypothetical protein
MYSFYSGSVNAPSSAAAEATAPGPSSMDAASKQGEGKVSQAMLAKDAQTDAISLITSIIFFTPVQ